MERTIGKTLKRTLAIILVIMMIVPFSLFELGTVSSAAREVVDIPANFASHTYNGTNFNNSYSVRYNNYWLLDHYNGGNLLYHVRNNDDGGMRIIDSASTHGADVNNSDVSVMFQHLTSANLASRGAQLNGFSAVINAGPHDPNCASYKAPGSVSLALTNINVYHGADTSANGSAANYTYYNYETPKNGFVKQIYNDGTNKENIVNVTLYDSNYANVDGVYDKVYLTLVDNADAKATGKDIGDIAVSAAYDITIGFRYTTYGNFNVDIAGKNASGADVSYSFDIGQYGYIGYMPNNNNYFLGVAACSFGGNGGANIWLKSVNGQPGNAYYAYKPANYTVTYDTNNGSGTKYYDYFTADVEGNLWAPGCTVDGAVIDPQKDGTSIQGWNTKADGSGTAYVPGEAFTATGDVTLYATYCDHDIVWSQGTNCEIGTCTKCEHVVQKRFTVTYEANGCTGLTKESEVITFNTSDANAATNVTPTAEVTPPDNLVFFGWNTNPDAAMGSRTLSLSGNTTLYAIYGEDPFYHIEFNVNGTANMNGNRSAAYYNNTFDVEFGDTITVYPANLGGGDYHVTKDGWSSIKGWSSTKENADNGITDIFTYSDNNQHVINIDYEALDTNGDHVITLYACWQRVVELRPGQGGNGQPYYFAVFAEGNNHLKNIISGTEAYGAADEYENAALLRRLSSTYGIAPTNPDALFNGWVKGSTRLTPSELTKEWLDNNCQTAQNLVLDATWRVEGYTITYSNGNVVLGTQIVAAPVPGEPVEATLWGKSEFSAIATGWALCGWTTNYSNQWYTDGHTYGTQYFDPGQKITLTGDITLYGYGTKTQLMLKYDANGGYWDHGAGSGSGADTNTKIHYNNTLFGTVTPCVGTSDSWYRFPTETPSLGRAGYRMHTSLNHIEIPRFYTADGKGHGIKSELNNGYGYDCWPDAAYDSYLADWLGLKAGDTLMLYAAWDPIITYNMNYPGGQVIQDYNYITSNNMYTILGMGGYTMYSSSNSVEGRDSDGRNALRQNREGYNGPVSIPSSRSGYTFRGWNTKPDGTGTSYSAGTAYNVATPLVLYAQWSKTDTNTVYIKYADQNGGNFSGENLASLPSVHVKTGTTNLVNGTKRGYTFGGWYTNAACTGMPITKLTTANTSTTTLYAKWTPVNLTVTFKSDDGSTTLGVSQVTYGGNAAFGGLVPGKPRTAQYSYTFSKWVTAPGGYTEANLGGVLTNLTVYACYAKTINTYSVKWSVNGQIVNTETLKYGATPKYRYADPEVAGYTFKGWTPEFAPVTQNVTYTAVLESNTPEPTGFTVTWINYNMALLEQDKGVEEGTMPSYDGATPTKPADSRYRYEFAGWDKELTPVTGNVMYQATFTQIPLEPEPHTHTWGEWQVITEATATTDGLRRRYCTGCDEYEEEIIPATGVVNTYTVTWTNYNLALLEQDKDVPEGTMPSYDGATPTKPADSKYRYEFAGWDKALTPVTGNIMYQATFNRIALEPEPHTHTWGDWQVITEATATTDGLRRRYCTGCDEYQEEIIPATGETPVYDDVVSAENYNISFADASNISAIRIAAGNLTTTSEIKNAPGCININKAVITEGTDENDVYTYEVPDGGVWSVWYKLTDGTTKIVSGINLTYMTQTVDTYGVTMTVNNLFGVKDFFVARGHYTTYRDVKNAPGSFSVTRTKFAGAHSYTYGAAVGDPGQYTICIRYEDSSRADSFLYFNCEVTTPTVDVFGKNITVGNIDDIRVIRVAPGTFDNVNAVKNAEGVRNFTASTISKLGFTDALTVNNAANEDGSDTFYTITIEYRNLYTEVHNITINKLMPNYTVSADSITFTGLEGLDMIRCAPGTYSTPTEIKNAAGSRYVKGASVTGDTVTFDSLTGTYTFLVQYNENSRTIFTLDF